MIFNILGLMSGTSLDGLDMAACQLDESNLSAFKLLKTRTIEYPEKLTNKLRNSTQLTAINYIKLHKDYGKFIATEVNKFKKNINIDFISSHGHTSIHFPGKNINFQLGDGATISAQTALPVVCDLRSTDIALQGQGAPLVPGAEKLLFPDFNTFLNIGGFANISSHKEKITAYDICPANFALNYFARKLNKNFDYNGEIGQTGIINHKLLKILSEINFFAKTAPKSLSDHWFFDKFLPLIDKFVIPIEDKLRTIYELIAHQIAKNINKFEKNRVLTTGGGVFNQFLIKLIQEKTRAEIHIPDKNIVQYKEALIFAVLGLLRWQEKENCFASVTGAKVNNIGGCIYYM